MNDSISRAVRQAAICGFTLALFALRGFAPPCRAEGQGQAAPQLAAQTPAPPPSTLQVTVKAGRFSIDASGANVLSVLKALFDQAERQFAPNSSVTGDVTLRLTGQPFRTVLDAICAQTFLRYRIDPATGIFYFQRDEEAVKNAFARIRAMNGLLRQQLRGMGLEVPPDNLSANGVYGYAAGAPGGYMNVNGVLVPKNGYIGGGAAPPQNSVRMRQDGTQSQVNRQGGGKDFSITKNLAEGNSAQKAGGRDAQAEKRSASAPTQNDSFALDNNDIAYRQFLAQNNFVAFDTLGQDIPITDVLQQLGQQANVPVLIDQNVPKGMKFRIRGSISPRTLPEALNALAPYARLDWRWVGSRIFVTTAPDFQIFYGESDVPRAYSRAPATQKQRAQQEPAGTAGPQGEAGKGTEADKKNPPKEKEPEKDKGN